MNSIRTATPKVLVLGLLLLASVLAAVFGLGRAYNATLTPQSPRGTFKNIGTEGWVQSDSTIELGDLFSVGNRAFLTFNPWRPAPATPAEVVVSVCGEKVAEFTVASDTPFAIPLRGSCEPRTMSFEIKNPFSSPSEENRILGVKLKSVSVTSRLGMPVVSLAVILECAAGIFLLTGLILLLSPSVVGTIAALIVPIASFLLIQGDSGLGLRTQIPLWICVCSLAAGLLLSSRLGATAKAYRISRYTSETNRNYFEIFLILAVVAIGAAIRVHGITFGLPANFHPDEVPKVNAIMRMVDSHTLNPQYFLHPSLLLYSSYFVGTIYKWLGIQSEYRTALFLGGRTVSLIAGTISIYLVYGIGRRLFSSATGIGAAALLAIFPLHVTCSRYMKEDALLTFFVLATVLAVLRAVQEERKGFLYLAGALAGCAASSKYPGLLAVTIVLSAPWLKTQSFKPDFGYMKSAILASLLVPVFFVICTPYSLITPEKFLKDFASESHHMERGHTVQITSWSQLWMYHYWRSLFPGMTPITTILATMGLGFLLWRRRIDDLFVVGLVLLYYLPAEWVKAKPEPQPERYVLPCLPFMALAAIEMLRGISRSRLKALMPAVAALAIVAPGIRSFQLAKEVPHDTRIQMRTWMLENLPAGAKVAMDWKPYCPPLLGTKLDITYLLRSTILSSLRVKELKKSGYDYLVLSSLFYDRYFTQPHAPATLRQLFRDLYEQIPVVKEISPEYGTYGFNNPKITLFSLREVDIQKLEQELALKREGKLEKTSNEMLAQFRWAKK